MNRIYIDVPFRERNDAKSMGANWDPAFPRGAKSGCWFMLESNRNKDDAVMRWGKVENKQADNANVAPPALEQKIELLDGNDAGRVDNSVGLGEFLRQISRTIEARFSAEYWVRAELSEIKSAANGHVYMILVESINGQQNARVSAMVKNIRRDRVFASITAAIGSMPVAGMTLLVKCKPVFSEKFGFSLDVSEIDPSATIGGMEMRLRQLRQKLKSLELYDANKKFAEPKDFHNVAVVAPEGAAGLQDFQREIDAFNNSGVCRFRFFSAVFQGDQASKSISTAFSLVLEQHNKTPFDLVVVVRGGGAVADLAWLNDEKIALAAAAMPMPILTGLGHEKDDTILDEIACIRAGTPSKAAHFISSRIIGTNIQAWKDIVEISARAKALIDRATQTCIDGRRNVVVQAKAALSESVNKVGRDRMQLQSRCNAILDRATSRTNEMRSTVPVRAHALLNVAQTHILSTRRNICTTARGRIQEIAGVVERSVPACLQTARKILQNTAESVESLKRSTLTMGPLETMRRGFAIALAGKKPIVTAKDAGEIGEFSVVFQDGAIQVCTIQPKKEPQT